jgi:hypothetical protein
MKHRPVVRKKKLTDVLPQVRIVTDPKKLAELYAAAAKLKQSEEAVADLDESSIE